MMLFLAKSKKNSLSGHTYIILYKIFGLKLAISYKLGLLFGF